MSTGIQSTVEQLQRRVLGSREERARAFVMGARLVDGTDLSLRFEPARPIEKVRVHVQSTAAGEGGGDYSAVDFTSEEDVDCRGSKVQDYAVTLDPAERYFVWVIPLVQDGAGAWHQRLDEAEYLDVAPEGSALWEPVGSVAAHVAAADPHTQYHNNARGDARYDALGAAAAAQAASEPLGAAAAALAAANAYTDGEILNVSGTPIEDFTTYAARGSLILSVGSDDVQALAPGAVGTVLLGPGTGNLPSYGQVATSHLDPTVFSSAHTWGASQIFNAAASFQNSTVPFVVLGEDRVDHLNAQYWDGLGRGTSGQVVLAVTAGAAVYGQIDNSHVLGAAAIAWSKISKTGSSLADLGTRSAADLGTGNLAYARLPSAGGTWSTGGGTITFDGQLAPASLNTGGAVTGLAFIPSVGGSLAAGRLVRRADLGMVLYGTAGSSRCFNFLNDLGQSVVSCVAGTDTLRTDAKHYVGGEIEIDGALNHDGSTLGVFGVTPAARVAARTISNDSANRTLDVSTATLTQCLNFVATMARDLITYGLYQ